MNQLTLKSAKIVREDGSIETVFVPIAGNLTWRDHVQFVSVIVGIVALGLTAYSTLRILKHNKEI